MLDIFEDKKTGGLFLYGNDSEKLIARPKEVYDGAIPSGNSVAILNLLKLGVLIGEQDFLEKADSILKTFGETVKNNPLGYTFFLSTLLFSITPHKQVIISGSLDTPKTQQVIQILNERFEPFLLTLLINKDQLGLIEKHIEINKGFLENIESTVYLCENFTCHAPTSDVEEFKKLLENS